MKDISLGLEELSLLYDSDVKEEIYDVKEIKEEYKRILSREIEREKIVGTSLYGVHRDDVEIFVNGKSARAYSSQGQQRSIVLSLKLAEGEVNREICGEYPVFLFDDVLSELDEKRREFLLSGIGERQVIITSCEEYPEKILAQTIYRVKNGEYEYVSSHR